MRRFGQSSYSYSPFWEYQQRTLKARLSAALGGFDKDILERFYSLTPDQLVHLFNIYSKEYGDGPATYARRTYNDWKLGTVRPNFVNNADLMDQRKKDYQMSAEFEGASGITKIQVGRNWSKTVVAGAIGILLVFVLLYVLTRLI